MLFKHSTTFSLKPFSGLLEMTAVSTSYFFNWTVTKLI